MSYEERYRHFDVKGSMCLILSSETAGETDTPTVQLLLRSWQLTLHSTNPKQGSWEKWLSHWSRAGAERGKEVLGE